MPKATTFRQLTPEERTRMLERIRKGGLSFPAFADYPASAAPLPVKAADITLTFALLKQCLRENLANQDILMGYQTSEGIDQGCSPAFAYCIRAGKDTVLALEGRMDIPEQAFPEGAFTSFKTPAKVTRKLRDKALSTVPGTIYQTVRDPTSKDLLDLDLPDDCLVFLAQRLNISPRGRHVILPVAFVAPNVMNFVGGGDKEGTFKMSSEILVAFSTDVWRKNEVKGSCEEKVPDI